MNSLNSQNNIPRKILESIEELHVEPKPRWHFVLQEMAMWVFGFFATLCGALAVSTILFELVTAPIQFNSVTHENLLDFWMDFMPLLWAVIFASFVFVADFFIKKTKRGYKYSLPVVTLSSILLSVVIGYAGFIIGLGEFMDQDFGKNIPYHDPVRTKIEKVFDQPGKGLITGQIVDEDKLSIRTNDGELLSLDVEGIPVNQREYFVEGRTLNLIGTSTSDGRFSVCAIIPLQKGLIGTTSIDLERKTLNSRNNVCKGVRPYERLKEKVLKFR